MLYIFRNKIVIAAAAAVVLAAIVIGVALFSFDSSKPKAGSQSDDQIQIERVNVDPDPSMATRVGSDEVGNNVSGYIKVPSDWEIRTRADYGQAEVDARSLSYVVDPKTNVGKVGEYDSRDTYENSILMMIDEGDFNVGGEVVFGSYVENSDGVKSVAKSKTTFNGMNCYLIEADMESGIHMTRLICDIGLDGRCLDIIAYSNSVGTKFVSDALSSWHS